MALEAVLKELKGFYTSEESQFSSIYLIRTEDLRMPNLRSFAMAPGGGGCKGKPCIKPFQRKKPTPFKTS